MRDARSWDERDQARLEKMWAEGMTSGQIAEATGRSRSAIMGRIGRSGLKRPRPTAEQTKNAFAEHLSLGRDVAEASRRMGITRSHGYAQLAQIREDLGWQAR